MHPSVFFSFSVLIFLSYSAIAIVFPPFHNTVYSTSKLIYLLVLRLMPKVEHIFPQTHYSYSCPPNLCINMLSSIYILTVNCCKSYFSIFKRQECLSLLVAVAFQCLVYIWHDDSNAVVFFNK